MIARNAYTGTVALAVAHYQAEKLKAQKPCLTLITEEQAPMIERNQAMNTPENQHTDAARLQPNGQKLSDHWAFVDIEEHQRILSMGSGALKGIGAMMMPATEKANEGVSANRGELSEIFSFFGEVMTQHTERIADAIFQIEQAVKGGTVR